MERLVGMAEAERQESVAKRLYEATKPKVAWNKLGLAARRKYIDMACQPPHVDMRQ